MCVITYQCLWQCDLPLEPFIIMFPSSGKLEEAEDLIRKNLDAWQKVLGLDHPDSITSVSTLADCLSRQGKLIRASGL